MRRIYNQTKYKQLRSVLRQQMTKGERLLWWRLRRGQLDLKFKRQFGIAPYVVDFCSPTIRLIIEVDGITHDEQNYDYDIKRQKYLESLGWTVIRYDSKEVLERLDQVVYEISQICEELKKKSRTISVDLSAPRGTSPC